MPSRAVWNERHAISNEVGTPDAVVVRASTLVQHGTALDIACGKGRNALYLARSGFRVLALDFSDVAIAGLVGVDPNLTGEVADLEQVSLPQEAFDLICNIRYLQRSLFPSIITALKPGGVFAASIAMEDDDPLVKPMNASYLLRCGELRAAFAALEVLVDEERKVPGKRRMADFIGRLRT